MKTAKHTLGIIAILLLLGFGLYAESAVHPHESEASRQVFCPVMPDEPIDPDIWTIHDGQKIYLCCKKCKRKFLADPGKYLPPSTSVPIHEEIHSHGDHGHADGTEDQDHSDGDDTGAAHDHGTDHGADRERSALLTFLGKLHPLAVHFPIALLLTAFLTEAMAVLRKPSLPMAGDVARVLVVLGAASAVAAAGLGWLAAGGAHYPGDLSGVLWRHRWLGISVAGLSVVAATLSCLHQNRKRWVRSYRVVLALTAILVGVTGHHGATLIYGLDYFTW